MNGIINVYKEKGFTSFDVVAVMKGICKQRKIGHTGTLDPDAEGVLPICLGNATKLCDMLTDRTKEYVADFMFGFITDTLDTSGTILEKREVQASEEQIRQAILSFLGEYDQVPPMYSALKIDGKRLYELAREGKTVERKSRKVTIYNIEIMEMKLPSVRIRVACSKGTYIRSLCADIAASIGELATMSHLTRTRVGSFTIQEAYRLEELQQMKDIGTLEEHLVRVDQVFGCYPAVQVLPEFDRLLQNGNKLADSMFTELHSENLEDNHEKQGIHSPNSDLKIRVYDPNFHFCGIYTKGEADIWTPEKMFLEA